MNFFSPRKQPTARVLLLGWPGKTSFLYLQCTGKSMMTIPTIGFNVESFKSDDLELSVWDIGGCDKIVPLVRHYYDNTEAVIFFVGTRKSLSGDISHTEAVNSVNLARDFIVSYDLPKVPLAFFCVQRDLPADQILTEAEALNLFMPLIHLLDDRPWVVLFGSATCPLGQDKLLQWVTRQIVDRRTNTKTSNLSKVRHHPTAPLTPADFTLDKEGSQPSGIAVPASESDALDDDAFLDAVKNYTLPSWDHKTHLRLAFIVLTRDGRRLGVSRIMELIKNFIDNSPRTSRGKTFHVTMTYFWIQMIHYALQTLSSANPDVSFDILLAEKPWLMYGGLFRQYYSDRLMLLNPEARVAFVLPDKKALPNVL